MEEVVGSIPTRSTKLLILRVEPVFRRAKLREKVLSGKLASA
jgi:hypothetical protein